MAAGAAPDKNSLVSQAEKMSSSTHFFFVISLVDSSVWVYDNYSLLLPA